MERGLILSVLAFALAGIVSASAAKSEEPVVGMYVHQHWPYKRPYAARTWTLADWSGYIDGLKRLGYNTVMIWPVVETMPTPLTPSDEQALAKTARVIDMLHERGMRAWIVVCPNVGARSSEAAKASFETRHFFYSDTRIDPADPIAVRELMHARERTLRPLARADAMAIIDSDPGGYPHSTNAEFVALLGQYRQLFDRLRPGIKLIYWMHAGWESYARFYETGKLVLGTEPEHRDALEKLAALNPEPWGVANGLAIAGKIGQANRVVQFNYGVIEGEPSFPLTNFGGEGAYAGGANPAPVGVMGNAQTHAVQLPNTFAFARGARHEPVGDADYIAFAERLVPGKGQLITDAWRALHANAPEVMDGLAGRLHAAAAENPPAGDLAGLLFGSTKRFLTDLEMMLRYQSTRVDYITHAAGEPAGPKLREFVEAASAWQKRHGYQNLWWDPELFAALRQIGSADVNALLDMTFEADAPPGGIAFHRVEANLRSIETHTTRLVAALRHVVGL